MKKHLPLVLIFLSLLFASCPSEPETFNLTDSTALDYFINNNLSAGWNLGNTLDAHRNGVGGETEWVGTAVNQALMNGVKAAGFNLIRIPVTWGDFGAAPDYTIKTARLNRVAEVVNMAHTAGFTVIINIHHDDNYWLSVKKARDSASDKAQIDAQFRRVWEQIAAHFKDYDQWLMFESMNEIQDGRWGWSDDFRTANGARAQFAILNNWNQIFTDVVRSTGGNNETRFLVIPSYATIPECTYPGGRIKDHPVQRIGDNFELPVDPSPGRQVVTFHYYRPDNVGLGGGNNRPARSDWGTPQDKNTIDNDFKPFKEYFIDRNIPVIIGECGASRQVYSSDPAKQTQAHNSRKAYLAHIFGTAKKYGLVPVYWDNGSTTPDQYNGESFGLFSRTTGQANSSESRECIEAMINAIK
ncbi:MAG: glycoside hydrolase family 5 protein [Spirochaetaceae bacterium]|jgi:aryl-phospho-beta-D-glucosidase BglC (GH1 family)|nr:glycoside hydrolase family 5 protein [Spirochaetaceae bacterium]